MKLCSLIGVIVAFVFGHSRLAWRVAFLLEGLDWLRLRELRDNRPLLGSIFTDARWKLALISSWCAFSRIDGVEDHFDRCSCTACSIAHGLGFVNPNLA